MNIVFIEGGVAFPISDDEILVFDMDEIDAQRKADDYHHYGDCLLALRDSMDPGGRRAFLRRKMQTYARRGLYS